MNIVREDIDALNATLKVVVSPKDYESKVSNALIKYSKTAKIPGFRDGKIPMGMIKKQYGKGVLSEELNRFVNESLHNYITENKIDILGNPIPSEANGFKGDFEKPTEFEFTYDIGLVPDIKVALSSKNKFNYYKVKVDKKLIEKQTEDLRRRYGKLVSVDEVGEKDMILAQFVELNEDQSIKEAGVLHSSTISMEFVEDQKTTKELLGKKVGDKVIVDPAKVSKGGKDTAAMLGVKEDELNDLSNEFQMTITEIKTMEMAELSIELYDKLFGEGIVKDEKELKARITSDLDGMFVNDSDKMLTRSVYDALIEKTKVELPDAFMKRWIKLSNEKEIGDEQIAAEYDGYAKGLKWQLIQGRIFKDNDIKLEQEEVMNYTKGLLVNNYAQYGMPAPEDKELTASAMQVLQNKEEATRIYDMLGEQKLTTFFKKTVKLTEKEISYDDFVEMASK
ncbi:MAG: trigger factor [Flavobacteriales bacterium]